MTSKTSNTFDAVEVPFERQRNGWYHANGDLPERFHRNRGPLCCVTPDNRVKAWGTDLDAHVQPINAINIQFERRGPNAFQAQLTPIQASTIRTYKVKTAAARAKAQADRQRLQEEREARARQARQDRISAKEAEFATVFGENGVAPVESPATNARQWCYHIHERDGRTPLFWFFRGAINHIDVWQDERKSKLEARVASEIERSKLWITTWTEFRDWWAGIPVRSNVYNDRFLTKLLNKFNQDIQGVQEQLTLAEEHGYRGEIELAAKEVGLEVWEESEDWDDGYIWFRYPNNGLLFPYSLLWLNAPNNPWHINAQYSINEWMLKQSPIADVTQDQAWRWATSLLSVGVTKVGPNFKLTNRLLPYVGGYQNKPNALYRPCVDQVRAYADNNPPPVDVPLF